MLDPRNDMLPPPSSPTNSSISSSDLDTESTGSFFHDRSTTLGTLMGVTFPAITFRAPSQQRHPRCSVLSHRQRRERRKPRKEHDEEKEPGGLLRWRSGGEGGGGACAEMEVGAKPASLREFLEVERRFGDAALEIEGVMVAEHPRNGGVNGRLLFADGRVLPPADAVDDGNSSSSAGALWRFPVSLTGICSGGSG
ncbi:hypothetical protein OIU78_029478 [Salix suchowensis]|nr:hypothetical protein OIU78_029478 [Salix suchowensis]